MERDKKDAGPTRPRATSSRFDTEYSFAYKKPSSSGRQPVTYQTSSYEIPSSSNGNTPVRVTKPRTPYAPPHMSRNCVRSSTAMSTLHAYDKINKMEQIIKSSAVSGRKGNSIETLETQKTAGPDSPSSVVGHLSQMYSLNGARGASNTPRYDDMCAKVRGDDFTWSKLFQETDIKMKIKEDVTQQQLKESPGKESCTRRKGQGDNTVVKSAGSILRKPTPVQPATFRKTDVNIHPTLLKKKVRFCDKITTHSVPYEERGSNEWRKNLVNMNMTYRTVLNNIGFPSLGSGYGYHHPSPLQLSNYPQLPVNGWRNRGVDMDMSSSSENWHRDKRQSDGRMGNMNVKPKTPFNKAMYNLPTPRRH